MNDFLVLFCCLPGAWRPATTIIQWIEWSCWVGYGCSAADSKKTTHFSFFLKDNWWDEIEELVCEWRQNEFVLFDGMLMESMKQMNDCCRNGGAPRPSGSGKKEEAMNWKGIADEWMKRSLSRSANQINFINFIHLIHKFIKFILLIRQFEELMD